MRAHSVCTIPIAVSRCRRPLLAVDFFLFVDSCSSGDIELMICLPFEPSPASM
jgi:hypothetical protein